MKKCICCFMFLILGNISAYTSESFKSLIKYDIKGISINDKLICELNGFNYGTIDYGIYRQRGYYFAITTDNAIMGEGIFILETVKFEHFDGPGDKGMKCTLKDIAKSGVDSELFESVFVEQSEGISMLLMTSEIDGQKHTLKYFLIPRDLNLE